MKAGPMRHRLRLERAVASTDATGGPQRAWSFLASLMARVEPLRGSEFFQAGQSSSQVTTRVTVRYREDIRPDDRLVRLNGNALDIKTVLPDNRNRYLILMCTEHGE